MHRLASKAIERFVSDSYGDEVWSEIADQALPGVGALEPMILDDPWIANALLDAAEARLGKSRDVILEDLGGYLVSHRRSEPLRRLLRFGGADFRAFLWSLEDLPDRVRLAFSHMSVPALELHDFGRGNMMILVEARYPGIGLVLTGLLRGLADDYGALATIEHRGEFRGFERVTVAVHDPRFSEGRPFDLARPAAML